MRILVINCGSSSIKYKLLEIEEDKIDELASGLIDRIGMKGSQIRYKSCHQKREETAYIEDYKTGISKIAELLREDDLLNNLAGVGHRVVHGGEAFRESIIIDSNVEKQIEECCELAPLHNPANLEGIKAAKGIFPNVPHVAVFDTAFFQTLPAEAYLYALPYEWYEKYKIRRYGFHGTSHKYVSQQAAKWLGMPLENCSFITMHLGNGCSMAAIKNGIAVNTTMGMTPLEGLVMGTRCGDIDTAIVFYMMKKENLAADKVRETLEKKSGLLGLSGVSRDMRDIIEAAKKGNKRAELAIKIFVKRVKKYIGAYYTEIGIPDALIFTGGIGENSSLIRHLILEDLEHLGIEIDTGKNEGLKLSSSPAEIQGKNSKVKILVIPTNEELAIAKDTAALVAAAYK